MMSTLCLFLASCRAILQLKESREELIIISLSQGDGFSKIEQLRYISRYISTTIHLPFGG